MIVDDPRKAAKIEATFRSLEQFAVRGERCPSNGCHDVDSHTVGALSRTGRIRVEVFAHNFRRVTILTGEHAGKATAPHPTGIKPWLIMDQRGTLRRRHVNKAAPKLRDNRTGAPAN